MVTFPVASQMTGLPRRLPESNRSVTPEAMVIVVKLKILSPAGFKLSAAGSMLYVPGVV
jgi:hypothetical protein